MPRRWTRFGPVISIGLLALALSGCGDADDSPTFVTVPLECDARLDRFEERINWPDPATVADLQSVNADLFAVIGGLTDDCDPDVFERLDQIECDYYTSVSGADEAAAAFIASQARLCEDDGPDPDDPVATIEEPSATLPPARE